MVELDEVVALLERGPAVVEALYDGLPGPWLHARDPGEWSAHSVLAHMLTVEDHAWVHRIDHLLQNLGGPLPPIDRGEPAAKGDVREMLEAFAALRKANLERLMQIELVPATGVHHQLGPVTTHQILATWAVHDLNHIAQAQAAIASRYRTAVGPFIPNLGILGPPPS